MDSSRQQLEKNGFLVLDSVFLSEEIDRIIAAISNADVGNPNFRKSKDLFAIRRFTQEIFGIKELIFTDSFKSVIRNFIGENFFLVKSIYFDKPPASNWFVACHQDLTISVDKKTDITGYGPWTVKQGQFAVQPPLNILESIYTLRIHLDDTDENNGALRIIPGSHLHGIRRVETMDREKETEIICPVPKGGVMIMRPLLFHSSGRTTTNNQRRVIHLEFSNSELTPELSWSEKETIYMRNRKQMVKK